MAGFSTMPLIIRIQRRLLLFVAFLAMGSGVAAALNAQEQQIATLLADSPAQGRASVTVDPILSSVARERARDLAVRDYFAHTNPDGLGPNALVRQAGYTLPPFYDQTPAGNNIESIAAGYSSAQDTWDDWMNSPDHKRHLLAESSFYAAQTAIGVGYYYDATSTYRHYWVVLSAPPTGPTLTVASPAEDARLTAPQVTIAGGTAGSPDAARVMVRVENANGVGVFRDAVGSKNWTLSISDLAPGANTARVRSLDAAGRVLFEATRSFRYAILSPLLVEIEGAGSVSAGFLGLTQREVGAAVSITARPAAGWIFDHWSGSAQAATATIRFTMAEDFALTAHFVENPFSTRGGSYNGLVQSEPATHATSGFFKARVTATGQLTGQLVLGGKSRAFSGKFDATGAAEITIQRGAKLPPWILTLQLDLAGESDRITGTVSDGTFIAELSADQALPAGSSHFAAGRYTIRLPASTVDAPAAIPPGDGYAIVSVAKTGVTRLAGTLADGRTFSRTATLSQDGLLPIYIPFLAGTGSLAGHATVAGDAATIEGTAQWTKPARPRDRYFPAAFETTVGLTGARYLAPPSGSPVLAVTAAESNSALRLSAGDLADEVHQPTTLLPNNRVMIPDSVLPRLTLALTRSTGRITGRFTHPITGKASRISGVILQNENAARGFFLGEHEGGAARFEPAD